MDVSTSPRYAVRRLAGGSWRRDYTCEPLELGTRELTIRAKNSPVQTRTTRLQRLDYSWHFPCSCRLCTASSHQTEASDARVRQIVELRKQFRNWGPDSQATPAMGDLLVSLYEQERLWNIMHEAYTFAAIEYNGAGEPWTATKYARLAIQRGLLSGGPQDHDVLEMKALARDPWSHWSWMLRAKRRMNWVSNISE